MKNPKIVIPSLAIGLAGLLSSCMDPYYGGGSTTTTVTEYHRPGYAVNTLPARYETEVVGGVRYYRHENVYYRPQGSRYVVVEAPRGSRGWEDRNRNGRPDRYDDRGDRGDRRDGYDRRESYDRRDGYEGRDSYGRPDSYRRETTVIRTLPSGAQVVTHRGTRYYQAGNTYYQSRGDGYVIVDRPF